MPSVPKASNIVSRLIEGPDDADDSAPLEVSGPATAENALAEEADAIVGAAERLSGFVDRRANAGNPEWLKRAEAIRTALADLVEEVEQGLR